MAFESTIALLIGIFAHENTKYYIFREIFKSVKNSKGIEKGLHLFFGL